MAVVRKLVDAEVLDDTFQARVEDLNDALNAVDAGDLTDAEFQDILDDLMGDGDVDDVLDLFLFAF